MMDDEEATLTQAAIARLSASQLDLVGLCLRAIVDGPYLSNDDEFHTVMGATRAEAAKISGSWSQVANESRVYMVVNNALNNLLGYPHGRWTELETFLGADEQRS